MSERDRLHWDDRYGRHDLAADDTPAFPAVFGGHEHLFPRRGRAIDIACGRGRTAVWLAERGLDVCGVDISPVAILAAQDLADRTGVGERCHFVVADLDDGLPDGPRVDVVLCHLFRDARLDRLIVERLVPGGLLAIVALSEVDHGPGPFRAKVGELAAAFRSLTVLAAEETAGRAWLLATA